MSLNQQQLKYLLLNTLDYVEGAILLARNAAEMLSGLESIKDELKNALASFTDSLSDLQTDEEEYFDEEEYGESEEEADLQDRISLSLLTQNIASQINSSANSSQDLSLLISNQLRTSETEQPSVISTGMTLSDLIAQQTAQKPSSDEQQEDQYGHTTKQSIDSIIEHLRNTVNLSVDISDQSKLETILDNSSEETNLSDTINHQLLSQFIKKQLL